MRTRMLGASPLRRLLDGAAMFGEQHDSGELRWATQPYAVSPRATSPKPRPARGVVLMFPGEGAHFVGMARHLLRLPAARDLFDMAAETLGFDVARLCVSGPAHELAEHSAVCVLVTSLCAMEAAGEARRGMLAEASAAIGFGLGELAALVAAGALAPQPALRLCAERAAAAAATSGALLRVRLQPAARLNAALARARAAVDVAAPLAAVAQYRSPGDKVLVGDVEVVEWLEQHGPALGVIPVGRTPGAAHCARVPLAAEVPPLDAAAAARVPSALGESRGGRLVRLHTAPLRWQQLLARVHATGARRTLALGPARDTLLTLGRVHAPARTLAAVEHV